MGEGIIAIVVILLFVFPATLKAPGGIEDIGLQRQNEAYVQGGQPAKESAFVGNVIALIVVAAILFIAGGASIVAIAEGDVTFNDGIQLTQPAMQQAQLDAIPMVCNPLKAACK